MDNDTAPRAARPRLNPYARALRRERIFSRLRLGASCVDIAHEEGLSPQRVRKIVSDTLARQRLDDGPDYALLQLIRLEAAHELAAKTVHAGDLRALGPYLKVLERIDRYHKAGTRKPVYDEAARERLFAKLNRVLQRIEGKDARKAGKRAASPPSAASTTETNPDSGLSS